VAAVVVKLADLLVEVTRPLGTAAATLTVVVADQGETWLAVT
jgi:hypothetical protein